jgi:N-acetyltransferase
MTSSRSRTRVDGVRGVADCKVPPVPRSLAVTLSGTYVTLSPLALDDTPGLVAAATEDRGTYSLTSVPDSHERMAAQVRSLLGAQSQLEALPFATRSTETGEIVGMTRFLTLRWWFERKYPDAAEIGGTFLAASSQRTRINTEAKLLMLRHAFDVWGVQRVDLKTDERNERSRRAIERLGASFEGVLRNWQPSLVAGEEGQGRSSAMYSILPPEWPAIQARLEERLR